MPNFPDASNDDGRSFEKESNLSSPRKMFRMRESGWDEIQPEWRAAGDWWLATHFPSRWPRCEGASMSVFSYLPFFPTRSSSALSPLSTISRLTVVGWFTLTARTYGRSHSSESDLIGSNLSYRMFRNRQLMIKNECQVSFTPLYLEYN